MCAHDAARRRAASRYGRAGLLLALAIVLLAGTALFLIERDRSRIWSTAHQNAEDASVAMQIAMSGWLQQANASLHGIASDGPSASTSGDDDHPAAVLANAARFDPVSILLGVRIGGRVWATDGSGRLTAEPVLAALAHLQPPARGPAAALQALMQLPGDGTWHLPITRRLDGGDGAVAFALVPVQRLLSATRSLKLLPGSYVTLIGTDGRRLLRYLPETHALQVNGAPVSAASLARIDTDRPASYRARSIDGRETVFGHARSPVLPMVVANGIPTSALVERWLAASLAPALSLLAGMLAVALFGVRLRSALREQQQQHLANHDSLTGLLSRHAFMAYLSQSIEQAQGRGFAMYAAKFDLQPWRRYAETLDRFTPEALARRAEFAQALRSGSGLSLVYQPKVDLGSGAVAGFEVLTRWLHPVQGRSRRCVSCRWR